jgi:hypothetical protein
MGLTMNQKQAVTKQISEKYNKATKKEKGEMLDALSVSCTFFVRQCADLSTWWGNNAACRCEHGHAPCDETGQSAVSIVS